MCQNCVMGRCANLHIHILLHLPSLFFEIGNLRLGLKFIHINLIGKVGGFVTQCWYRKKFLNLDIKVQ